MVEVVSRLLRGFCLVLMVEAAVVAAAVVAKKEGCEAAYMCSQSPLLSRTGWVPASNFTSD